MQVITSTYINFELFLCVRKAISDSVGPISDVEIRPRSLVGYSGYVYTGNTPQFRIVRDGEIQSWHFYSMGPGNVALQVWRSNTELGAFRY